MVRGCAQVAGEEPKALYGDRRAQPGLATEVVGRSGV